MQCASAILSSVSCPSLQYFSMLSHELHDFQKHVTDLKCVLIFSTTSVRNTSHSKKNYARYDQKCVLVVVFMLSTRNSCPILMNLEFS